MPICVVCDKAEVIDQTAKDVAEIKDALLGNKFHTTGLIEKVHKTRVKITRIEKLIYIGTGAAMVITFLIKFVF